MVNFMRQSLFVEEGRRKATFTEAQKVPSIVLGISDTIFTHTLTITIRSTY